MPTISYTQPAWLTRWLKAKQESDSVDIVDFIPQRSLWKVDMVIKASAILDEYSNQGYQLTLRQLYYQFVSRDLIANDQKEYERLGDAISDGRMWGFLDWEHIVDRGRNYIEPTSWGSAEDIISSAANSFHLDWWLHSHTRPEVWVEKQALEEVIEMAARRYRVGHIACKGYMSQSEHWAAAQRIINRWERDEQRTHIIHLGDHDPSGIDMTDDLKRRFDKFQVPSEAYDVERIALNMDQVDEYNPPPNPAKQTDSRFKDYADNYGEESWELDALEPAVLDRLISVTIGNFIDPDYEQQQENEESIISELSLVAYNWEDAVRLLQEYQGE